MKNLYRNLRISAWLIPAMLIFSSLKAQQIIKVGAGEYATSYVTNTGRLFVPYFNGSNFAVVDVGLSNVVDADGAQYTTIARNSAGEVYVIRTNQATKVTTDINGNAFTGTSKVYGFYQTYLALKNGNIWYWGNDIVGQNGGVALSTPKQLIQPTGKFITKLVVSSGTNFNSSTIILALASDGTVWKYNNSSTNPQQINFTGKARDIAAVGVVAYAIETETDLLGWGFYGQYVGAPNQTSTPVSIKSKWVAAGVVFPTKELVGNYNTLHIIDQNDNMFGSGSNVQGEIGNGIEYTPWRTRTPYIWLWQFSNGEVMQAPVQIPGKFKNLQTSNTVTFYHYVQDMGNNWYSWGRNKSRVLGNGITLSPNAGGEDIYPNFRNVPAPTMVTPLTTAWTILTFNPNAAQSPLANPGVNQYIATSSTTLYGSASSQQEGTITNYAWKKLSGPSATISDTTLANPTVTGLSNGTYVFQLTVKNQNGVTASRSMSVVVSTVPPPNQLPVANAGTDKVITLPTNTTSLSGTATDADGTISTYAWAKIAGPATGTIASPSTATTTLNNLTAGVYQYQLTVKDNNGDTDNDTVKVTVNPAPNVAPTANAGTDITITLPANTTTLTGIGADTDGTISTYLWVKIAGPATGAITNTSTASTGLTALVQGIYKYQLTVTDNDGATAKDTVQVTVNPAPNVAPTANAGADISISLPTNSTTLNGSGTDTDGTIASYAWTKIAGPTAGTIATASSASTQINNLVEGVYQFRLTVTDDDGATNSDVVIVTVNAAPNVAPTANAGTDITITLPTNSTTLNGSGTDTDGTIASYAWTKIAGPTASTIASSSSASTQINNLVEGVYQFRLSVTDNDGATNSDVVIVTVNPAPNVAPTANAGTDITITLPTNSTTLNGSGTDTDGTIASYAWTKIAGPTAGTIASASSASTQINNLVEGVYQFRLSVTDNDGATNSDVVIVTVNPAPNVAPTANAGTDITITLPTNSTTLNGSGTDTDGTIASYAWTKIAGPTASTIASSSSASTQINNLVEGVYQFRLTITDDDGATNSDVVVITVNPAPNVAPTANAGNDITITLPTNSTTLTGSGTDTDGTISTYTWTKISGPTAGTIASGSSASTQINNLVEGVYQFRLTVKDDDGATNSDVVIVTVNAAPNVAPNVAPTANAGTDIVITLPTNTTTLIGNGIDSDGTISAYAWVKITGPSAGSINSVTTATTGVTGLVQGTYQFELTVTDNEGLTGKDTVQVFVNAAPNVPPTASAGPDITITLPTNSTTLTGSGTDTDGTINAYAWTKISGPATGSITNASSASAGLINLVQGVYQYQLLVTDNNGGTAKDTVKVTVDPAPNVAPTANAGSDITITLPVNTVTLNGSGVDNDGTIATYAWVKVSGPAANIITASSASTDVDNLTEGVYQFRLTVTDDNGATNSDIVQVTVNPAPNLAPTAEAGSDLVITLPVNTTLLNGSGIDTDGTIVSYNWSKISGPATGNISSATSASTTATNLVVGVYQFELTVTDNEGLPGKDTVKVFVNAAPNVLPTANAGSDISITLPTNSTTLNGGGTDLDGTINAYAWTKISGPATGSITNSSAASTGLTNLVQGVYQYQLTVTDNNGGTAIDTIKVTVNPAPNAAPTANAGSDITITLPTNTTTLTSSGIDTDGTISSYAWMKIAGPVAGTIVAPTSASTSLNNLVEGIYTYQLTVTDNAGATAKDTVKVTVNPSPNVAPTANAGSDIVITLPTNSIVLSGSGVDTDGSIAGYSWTKISGPAPGTIANTSASNTAVNNLVQGVYQFELTVTDNEGLPGKDTVKVFVNAAPNVLPTANAGNDIIITLPTNTTTLTGNGTDTDGSIISYNWIKISGPATGSIAAASAVSTTLNGLTQGVYQYQLTVTDNHGGTDKDTVKVTVNPAPNAAPTAAAGTDIVITLPINTTILNGSGVDTDGTISSYAWIKISGPATGSIANATTAIPTLNNLIEGVYQYQLTVTDNSGATARDTVKVTVNPAPNVAPTATAGTDIVITLPTNAVTLTGSGTDVDGTISAYSWIKISGPATGNITVATSANTTVTGLTQGVYQYQLTVTDNDGLTAKDTLKVFVNAAPNVLPTANAGNDIVITLPINAAVLQGSGTDLDGSIIGYNWVKITGPTAGSMSNAATATANLTGLVHGMYQYQLTITDNNGGTAKDTVKVTVNPAPNQLPTANAGADIVITLPTNATTLNGSGTDADGSIAGYNWVKIAGPTAGSVSNATIATANLTGLVQGVYQYQMTVTDNNGGTDKDTVKVTVNPAPNQLPTANAGADIVIILPTNAATLNGSGTDVDGTITGYSWTKIAGPTTGNIVNPATASTGINNLVEGVYVYQLLVTDNSGATDKDTVKVTINAAPNAAPVANAGADITLTFPVNTTTLNGTGTDADGVISSYAWVKISGPNQGAIVNATSATSTLNSLILGTYIYQLTVTDNRGATGKDTIIVFVKPPVIVNNAPYANAGDDIDIVLPINEVSLAGLGLDTDGTIEAYSWRMVDGPDTYSIISPNRSQTQLIGLGQGVYKMELTVTDNRGATGRDTMTVTVSSPRLSNVEYANAFRVYPNPVHDIANLTITTSRTNARLEISVVNAMGMSVSTSAMVLTQTTSIVPLDMTRLRPGTYFISISFDGQERKTVKVIKVR